MEMAKNKNPIDTRVIRWTRAISVSERFAPNRLLAATAMRGQCLLAKTRAAHRREAAPTSSRSSVVGNRAPKVESDKEIIGRSARPMKNEREEK